MKAYRAELKVRGDLPEPVGPWRASTETALRDMRRHNRKHGNIYAESAYVIRGIERGDWPLSELTA